MLLLAGVGTARYYAVLPTAGDERENVLYIANLYEYEYEYESQG